MKSVLSIWFAVLFASFGVGRSAASIYSTAIGGNWNAPSTWVGGSVPAFNDLAMIVPGATVTVTADVICSSIGFDSTSASSATVTVNPGVTLTVRGTITCRNSPTTNTSAFLQGAGTVTCNSVVIGGTATPTLANSDCFSTFTTTVNSLSIGGNPKIKALYNSNVSAANQGVFAIGSGTVTAGNTVQMTTVPFFGPILTLAVGAQNGTLVLNAGTPFSFTGGGSYTFAPAGTNATVVYGGTAQTVLAAAYQNLTLSGSGAKTTAGVTVNGVLSRRGTATVSTVPTYGPSATLEYKGSAAQTSGPELAANLPNLAIDNTNGVALAGTTTVSLGLSLVSGKLTTAANQVNLGAGASVSGASPSSYVNGNVQKTFSVGAASFTFPVGDASGYAPLSVSNLFVTASGGLKASTTAGSHPQAAASGIDANRDVNRYWTLTQSGGAFGSYDATFNYPATEVSPDANPARFAVKQWTGSVWSPATRTGMPTVTATSIGGQNGFGDFVVGDPFVWYNIAWPYRLVITIDHTLIAADLTNFPVLVSLTNSTLAQYAQTNGNDLLFTSTNLSKLAHEIESYASSNGALVAWVNVPLLSSTVDTTLYLHFGNPSSTNQQNPAAVWDSNFKGVWHLNQIPTGSAGDMADSTSVNNDGTSQTISSGAQNAGAIGGSLTLDGSSDYVSTSVSFTGPNNLTIQAWVKTTSAAGTKVVGLEGSQTGNASSSYDRHIYVGTDGKARFAMYNPSRGLADVVSSTNAINDGQWHSLVACRNGAVSNLFLYVDGVLQATNSSSSVENVISWYRIGSYKLAVSYPYGVNGYFAGSVDEVRVSHEFRGASWIVTEYRNESSPTAFCSVGDLQTAPPARLAITSVNNGSSPTVGAEFNVVVEAQGQWGTPQFVESNTVVSLSVNTGSGTLGGTVTAIIPAGTSSTTISGVTYTTAESGVVLTATTVSGDSLTADNSGPFTVNPGDQTITFPSPGDHTYGAQTIALTATASSGLPVSYGILSGPGVVSSNELYLTGAGSITIEASQPGDANWNAATPVSRTISIAPKLLIPSVTVSDKVYDGSATAVIATYSLTGIVPGDLVDLAGGTATFADKTVGDNKPVIATGLSLGGSNAPNYVLSTNTAMTVATITPALLTITASDTNRPYGAPNPVFTAGYEGFVNGEGMEVLSGSPELETVADALSPPGTYPITVATGTLASTNYTFAFADGTLTITEIPPVLTIEFVTESGGGTNHVILRAQGMTPGIEAKVEASTDLKQWAEIASLVIAPDGSVTHNDFDVPQFETRFYRLVLP